MKIPTTSETTSDERLMAALSHFSVLLPVVGIIVPVIVWLTHRTKSTFVRFHSLQALVYQLFQTVYQMIVGWIVGMLGFVLFMIVIMVGVSIHDENTFFVLITLAEFAFIGMYLLAFALYMAVGIIGAILVLNRKEFRYPLIGGWIKKFLAEDPEIEAAS